MDFENVLEFKGVWRSYQQRVLDRFQDYSQDKKIHIVAAPGSGKTTLGIELIKRLNQPALVLAPTITIREQWIERIKSAFLCDGYNSEEYLSQDLKNMKMITVVTYQSIHSAMKKEKGVLIEEHEEKILEKQEEIDYQDFDFFEALENANIQTLCLDECHHLRNEWWKALETLVKQRKLSFTISLTATPPYDSSLSLWNRYIGICGDIDEEITVPELVKEGSLCPHQDYVYFNYPTKEEMKVIKDFRIKVKACFDELMNDKEFEQAICTHVYLHQIDMDQALEKPSYLSSLLIFLEEKKHSYPQSYLDVLNVKTLEKMSIKWMEILLQGFLFDDCERYQVTPDYREALIRRLKSQGMIEKNEVSLQIDKAFEKMLVKSKGKCDSIKDIVFHEYQCLKKDLKLLILTDYIKKEYEKAVGNLEMDVHNLGVIPFFEMLRRENENQQQDIRFGVLCGSMVIIPADLKERLSNLIEEDICFERLGQIDDYVKVKMIGKQHQIVKAVSQLFQDEDIQVLIGTKSLLGEGWDSPCINTLILASFVGSFMLSNQMRGRAIRTFVKDPHKTSHIWHLVCMEKNAGYKDTSLDYETLKRRMEHFLGLHYEKDYIENGVDRLSAICFPLDQRNIKKTNQKMFELSKDRSLLKARWDRSLAVYEKIEVVEESEMEEKSITCVILFDAIWHAIIYSICMVIAGILGVIIGIMFELRNTIVIFYMSLIIFSFVVHIALSIKKIVTYKSPLSRLRLFGEGIYKAILANHMLESYNSRIEVETNELVYAIYLLGGTGHDKTLFAKCVNEFFDPIDNQRYILYNPRRKNKDDGYFVVPEEFAKRKEDAYLFAQYMKPFIGKYQVVYTRSQQGRKILLKGRIQALANKQTRFITKQKIKGALE